MWDELRRQLGPEFSYGPGHWFCVDHALALRPDGYPYSKKVGGSGRRVVLATAYGPNATLFARSASVESPYQHQPHNHVPDRGRCRIDEIGWVNFVIPVSVAAEALNDDTYSCEEPDNTTLRTELAKATTI